MNSDLFLSLNVIINQVKLKKNDERVGSFPHVVNSDISWVW